MPRYQAQTAARVARLHGDVFRDGHPVDQAEILMNERDWQRIDSGPDRPILKADLARVRLIDARQDFYQRGLARAVLAEQRMDFAASDVEIDVVERERPGEALGEAGDVEQRFGRRGAFRLGL